MKKVTHLYEALWVSTLAPDAPLSIVADIARIARVSNEARGLTGLLIFDGMRFCEQVEGEKKDVLTLVEHVLHDRRHIQMQILHQGPLHERRFKCFSLAYTEVDDPDLLGRLRQQVGQAAVDAFVALLPTLDLNP